MSELIQGITLPLRDGEKLEDMTVAQRSVMALEIMPIFEAEAKQRMSEGGKKGRQVKPGTTASGKRKRQDRTQTSASKAAELVGVGRSTVEAAKAIEKRSPELVEKMRNGEISVARAAELAGYERLAQTAHKGQRLKVVDENGKVPVYGKGDRWNDVATPLRRYIGGWETRNFEFRHINPREARKRLKVIEEIEQGLQAIRDDLEPRAVKAATTVEGR